MFSRREVGMMGAAFGVAAATGCATAQGPRASTGFDLNDLERRTFDWFWDTANPVNGLIPDRWPSKSFCSIAAVGFGHTALPIGVERG